MSKSGNRTNPLVLQDPWVIMPDPEDIHLTFISVPYDGDMESFMTVLRRYAKKARDMNMVPVNPYLMYSAMFPERDRWTQGQMLMMSLYMLIRCDEVWMVGCALGEKPKGYQYYDLITAVKREMRVEHIPLDEDDDEEDEDE